MKENKEIDFLIGKKRNFILLFVLRSIFIGTIYYVGYHRTKPLIFWTLVFFYPFAIFRTIKVLTSKNIFFISEEELKKSDDLSTKNKAD
jgi:hypothetical protein